MQEMESPVQGGIRTALGAELGISVYAALGMKVTTSNQIRTTGWEHSKLREMFLGGKVRTAKNAKCRSRERASST